MKRSMDFKNKIQELSLVTSSFICGFWNNPMINILIVKDPVLI